MKPLLTYSDGSAEFPNGLVRRNYRMHHVHIGSIADLKACLRAGAYSSVGAYPLMFLTSDGSVYSFKGVLANWREIVYDFLCPFGSRIVACAVNYEDQDLICDLTGKPIESAYAD